MPADPTDEPPYGDEPPSKSERKREAHRLQALGRALTQLNAAQLAEMPISDQLAQAVTDYQRFPSHGAKRRQLQFIGRLMRDLDVTPVQAALDTIEGQSAAAQYEFHRVERWRERLLAEPEALTEFLAEHPHADRQQLRQQLQRVQKAPTDTAQRAAARGLFRFLRDTLHPV